MPCNRECAAGWCRKDAEVFTALGVPKKFLVDHIAQYVVVLSPPVLRIVIKGCD